MRASHWALAIAGTILIVSARSAETADPLAQALLQVQGSRLTIFSDGNVSDADQVINAGEQARVRTCYGGSEGACGAVAAGDPRATGLEVRAELWGPELPAPMAVSTTPGGIFLLPSFQTEGDYVLDNIRLVIATTGTVVGWSEPRRALLHVIRVAVASATVTRLSLADLQARGIHLTQEDYQAFNFAVGFAFQGSTVTIDLPVLYDGVGTASPLSVPDIELDGLPDNLKPLVERWQAPSIVPFTLVPEDRELLDEEDTLNARLEFPVFGVIVLPGTVSFLNQFFEARLIVANAAPQGSGTALQDLEATLRLPAGNVLRAAATDPPVMAGQHIPLVLPSGGRAVPPGEQASASWTVEGLKTGNHVLQMDITGELFRPGRSPLPLVTRAQAAVEVVDARFNLTFSHPDVVRRDEGYTLYVTITNLSRAPQSDITLALRPEELSGAHRADPLDAFERSIGTLAPGQARTVEFALIPDITGRCFATTFQADSQTLEGTVHLRAGVGELGIPLSPATLVLPRFSERLGPPFVASDTLLRANQRLLGLAHSLATAPAGLVPAGLPTLTTRAVERRALDLAEAGQRTFLHDGLLESLEVLALDQLGNRDPLEGFDELRRRVTESADPQIDLIAGTALAAAFREEQAQRSLDAESFLDHFVTTTSYAAPYLAALVVPAGPGAVPKLEVRKVVDGVTRRMVGTGTAANASRGVPFGEIFELYAHSSASEAAILAVIGHVATGDTFQLWLSNVDTQPAQGRLIVVAPQPGSDVLRRIDLGPITLPPGSEVRLDAGPQTPDPAEGGFALVQVANGASLPGALPPEKRNVELPPFRIIGAVQDFRLGESRPDGFGNVNRPNVYGNGIAFLFNRPPGASVVDGPAIFTVRSTFDGLDVLGAPTHHVATKHGVAGYLQDDQRVLLVRYSGPISALLESDGDAAVRHEQLLSPLDVVDRFGEHVVAEVPPITIETTPLHVGGLVAGRVLRGSGAAAEGASVELLRVRDVLGIGLESVLDVVEQTTAGADGSFYFDFVEHPHWDADIEDQFMLRASVPEGADPDTEPAEVGEVPSVIRQQNRVAQVNIALLGRGTVTGRLVYAGSGAPIAGGSVSIASTLFREMKTAVTAADGGFTFGGVPVGPVTLTGRDADRNAVYATVGLDRPGGSIDVLLELQRAEVPSGEGSVTGVVVSRRSGESEAELPISGAQVAVYSGANPIAHQQTDHYGHFRFDHVPAGQVTVQAADWRISRTPVLTDLLLAAGETVDVTLAVPLSSPHAVVGNVYHHDPAANALEPVGNALVLIQGPGVYARTAADGSYRIDGVPVQGAGDSSYVLRAIDNDRRLQGETTLPAILDGSPEVIDAAPIVLEDTYGGVDGVVLDPLGRPYSGAAVLLFPYGSTVSDVSGHFSFNRIPIGTYDRLIAHVADGLRPGYVGYLEKVSTTIVCGGHRPFSTLRMRGSGVVRVHTSTSTSTGIRSLVYYKPTMYHDGAKNILSKPEYVESSTDDDGNFEVELPVGSFQIVVYNPFNGQKAIAGTISYAGQVQTYPIVFENAGTVAVTVYDADGITPAPNVAVTLETESLLPQTEAADALGQRVFSLVPQGSFRVSAAGVVSGVQRVGASVGAVTSGGQVVEVAVRLKAQGSVAGYVKELQGTSLVPIPFAQVYVHENTYPARRVPAEGTFVFADAQGRYQVQHLYAGGVTVIARDPAQVERNGSAQGVITADWQIAEMPDVVLSTSVGALAVTVKDPATGLSVADCQVTLDGQEATVTDAAGVARFEALPLGTHSVYAFHAPSGRGGRLGSLQLGAPGQVLAVSLFLDTRGEIDGTLFDDRAHNVPVVGGTIELDGPTSVGDLHALATSSGDGVHAGRFSFSGIPEGNFILEAAAPGTPRRAHADVALTATSPVADVALVLEASKTISVRIFQLLKESSPGGPYEVDPAAGLFSVRIQQSGYDFTQIEPAAGFPDHRYDFSGVLAERAATITVGELGGERRTARIDVPNLESQGPAGGTGTASDPYRLVLSPKGLVRVTVRDAGAQLIVGSPVTLYSAGGVSSSSTDGSGVAAFSAVPAGAITATAWQPNTSSGGIATGALTYDDDVIDLSITFAATVAARGVVYQPVPGDVYVGDPGLLVPQAGAVVEITDSGGTRQAVTTGDDGSYHFVGLAIGACTVRAWQPGADGFASLSGTVNGPSGNETIFPSMVLDAAAPRIVSIVPPQGMQQVSRTAVIEIVFSEPLAASVLPHSGVGGPVFKLQSGGNGKPPGTWSSEVDATSGRQIVRFTPSAPYENFTVYGLSIGAGPDGVRDRVGRLLAEFGSVGSNFKTADTVGPEVIGTEPTLARPVPADATIRLDLNEAIELSDEELNGDGIDDAAELYWERSTADGGVEWSPYPASLFVTNHGLSLAVTPQPGVVLAGDSLRRRLHVARVRDAFGNEMVERDLTFRARDDNHPQITVMPPAAAPDGQLSPGIEYRISPEFGPGSIDFVTEAPPQGDVDRVEYFLVDPTAAGAVPTFVARTFPFAFAFVAAYSGNGVEPQPFPLWVRAVDTSENISNTVAIDLVVVKNEPPAIASVDVAAVTPVAGTFYAGSAISATVGGLADADGTQVTVSAELWQEGATSPLAAIPGVLVRRPDSGSWADLPAPTFDLTLPLSLSEGTRLFVRARALDMYGAPAVAESPRFEVADDATAPRIDSIVARRSPDGTTPPVFFIADRFFVEFSARDGETAINTVAVSFDRSDLFPSPVSASRVPGTVTLYRTDLMTVPHDAFDEETTVLVSIAVTDIGGNVASGTLDLRLAPAADADAPTAVWLTPWEGGAWPARYVSTLSPAAGVTMLLRAAVEDTAADGSGGSVPGSIAAVEFRGPVRDGAGAIVLGDATEGTLVTGTAGPGSGTYECLWTVPNDISPGAVVPFEVRVVDTGGVSTSVPARLLARVARRVYEGVELAVLPSDTMATAGGDPAGPVFVLDGSTVSVYPQTDGQPRHVASLFLYAGGDGSSPVAVRGSVLTAPHVNSYASTVLSYPLELVVDETLAVGAGCSIDASGGGLLGNTSSQLVSLAGEAPAEAFAGGSHGGYGWFGSPTGGWTRSDLPSDYLTRPGSTFDGMRDPHLPGAGGTGTNSAQTGGRGGGVVRLLADSALVRISGEIRADGGSGSSGGGGAGGAVLVRARRLEGSGRITADGGDGTNAGHTGGGGGGRVALLYRELGADVDLAAHVGALGGRDGSEVAAQRFAGAGTVYVEELDPLTGQGTGVGHLVVGNRSGKPAAVTPLPALGDGRLVSVDIAAHELIVEVPAARGEVLGDSVVVSDGGASEVAVLRVIAQLPLTVPPGAPKQLRLGVDADDQRLVDLQALVGGSSMSVRGRSRYAVVECRGAARLVADDDLAIATAGEPNPTLNDRAGLSLDGEARVLLRGEVPEISFSANPPVGSEVRVGSTLNLQWAVSDPLGIGSLSESCSLTGTSLVRLLVEPVEVTSGTSTLDIQVGGSPPGPVTYEVTANDIAGRSATQAATWTLLPNSPPTVTIAFAPGTPAAVLPGQTVSVIVDASDEEGLQEISVRAAGPASPQSQSRVASGSTAHGVYELRVAEDATSSEAVTIQGDVLDRFAPAATSSSPLSLGILDDTEPPSIEMTMTPAAPGDVHTAGDVITVTVSATDNVAAHPITLTIDGQTYSSQVSPLTHVWTAPAVSGTTTYVIEAQASDPAGHHTTASRTVSVQPLINPSAPAIHFTCPSDGAYLPSGYDGFVLQASASDDIGVAFVEFYRDGETVPFATVFPPAGTPTPFAAIAPSIALPIVSGDQTVRFRARAHDASNNAGDAVITIHVVDAVTLDPSGNIDWTALTGAIGVLRTGTLVLDQPHTLGGLIVLRGASITHSASTPGAEKALNLTVSGPFYVECDASLDLSGRGYGYRESYAGASLPGGYTGGSHIGQGGWLQGALGATYGSVERPREVGGGGIEGSSTRGGGAVRVVVGGDATVDGAIRANGGDSSSYSLGAGGSVWMTVAGGITGSGVIEARGGEGTSSKAGGGGAMALEYGVASALPTVVVRGGSSTLTSQPSAKGGAGTIWLKSPTATYGELIVDNGGLDGQGTVLPSLGSGVAQAGSGGATLVTDRAAAIPGYFGGHWVEVSGAGGALKGTWRIGGIADRTVTLESNGESGEAVVAEGDRWQGVYRFDTVTVRSNGKLSSGDPIRAANLSLIGSTATDGTSWSTPITVAGTVEIQGNVLAREIHAHDLILRSGATLSHPTTTNASAPESLLVDVSGDLTIESGGFIDVTGRGYGYRESYAGASVPGGYSGASHVGQGGWLQGALGATYGSIERPREVGGGGIEGSSTRGGGAVRVVVGGDATVDGAIRANGGDSSSVSLGAGGSVWMTVAGGITGSGVIEARGGEGTSSKAGGGGAMALEYGVASALPTVVVRGGSSTLTSQPSAKGGAGTIWLKSPTATYGELIVDNGGLDGQGTVLPSLGSGVAQAGSGGATLVTDRAAAIPGYFGGHWVEVSGAGGALKGTWRIGGIADRTVTLESNGESGEAVVAEGDRWQGVYRFDTVTVRSNGKLSSGDPIRAANLSLIGSTATDGTSWSTPITVAGTVEIQGNVLAREIHAHDLILRSGATLSHPTTTNASAPESLLVDVSGDLTIESGGFIDVTGRGYGYRESYAGASVPGGYSGASHVGQGGWLQGALGATYGSIERPREVGGGGIEGSSTRGGGAVRVVVGGDATVDGAIRANGGDSSSVSLGAGGSVWMTVAGGITGSGVIEARGGEGTSSKAGGGGAMALEYGVASALPTVVVRGGSSTLTSQPSAKGGAGTIWLKSPTATYGELIVDNGGLDGQGTVLPSLGSGVAQAGSGGATLVTDRAAAIPGYFGGHWVEVSGAGGALKGTWRIGGIADRTVTLESNGESGEAVVAEGDRWQGVYRFDALSVRGRAKLDSEDGARVGATDVAADSQLSWFDDTPPIVDSTKITAAAHDHAFWVAGTAGSVVDPGGVSAALVRNRRTSEAFAVSVIAGGSFAPTSIIGVAGDEIELEVTSAHVHPVTVTAAVATLPGNTGAPVLDTGRIALARDLGGSWHAAGSAGAVLDDEPPIAIEVQCQPSGATASGTVAANGAFDVPLACVAGDLATLAATDGHPQPETSSRPLGAISGNPPPVISTGAIFITYEPPVSQGETTADAGYVLHLGPGAITDNEGPLDVTVRTADGVDIDSQVIDSGEAFDWRLRSADLTTGDVLTLTAADRDPTDPQSTTVEIGPLPPDNYGPPVLNLTQISLLPMGFGFQVAGRAGAVTDPDSPVTVTLSNPSAGWVSSPITVDADGSFYGRIEGAAGNEISIQAADSHPALPLSGQPISLGALPEVGLAVTTVDQGSHAVVGLIGEFLLLDGGSTVGWPVLRWSQGDPDDETVDSWLSPAEQVHDVIWQDTNGWPLVLAGADILAWVCPDSGECPTPPAGRMTVSTDGPLVAGLSQAGYLFLVSRGATSSMYVMPSPLIDQATGGLVAACNGAVATVTLPISPSARILDVFPAYSGEIAVLTDEPAHEIALLDVGDPTAPAFSRFIGIGGSAAPLWGVWQGGNLLLGRSDGSVEVRRWAGGNLEAWSSWRPAGSSARGAALMGDQLWVGLADGHLQQVDLADPAQPRLLGAIALGTEVVALSDLGSSLVLATESSLLHVWPSVMPPEISPASVAWGHRPGLSWARAWVESAEDIDSTTVRWGGDEAKFDASTGLYTIEDERLAPPVIQAIDEHGVRSGEYVPTDWQTWGDWTASGGTWFPSGNMLTPSVCTATVATAGVVSTTWPEIPWVASAQPADPQVSLSYNPGGAGTSDTAPEHSSLPISAPLVSLVSFGTALYVIDDGIGVWDLGVPASPTLLSHHTLFGGDPVGAARTETNSWPPLVVAAAGDPLRIATVDIADPLQPVVAEIAAVPELPGTVVDLARVRDRQVVVLLRDGSGSRLVRVDAGDPQAPSLLADVRLPAGATPVSVAAYCEETESGCDTGSFVAVVRHGWGVDTFSMSELAPLFSVPLAGVARDARVERGEAGTGQLLVTLGFGAGMATVTGLPEAASVTYLSIPGDTTTFVEHDAGRSGLHDVAVMTATGVVEVLLPRPMALF